MEKDYQETIMQLVCECRMLERKCEKQKEAIDKATNDLQQLIDDTKNKTVLSLGSSFLN